MKECRLEGQIRDAIRQRHYSVKTGQSHVMWYSGRGVWDYIEGGGDFFEGVGAALGLEKVFPGRLGLHSGRRKLF